MKSFFSSPTRLRFEALLIVTHCYMYAIFRGIAKTHKHDTPHTVVVTNFTTNLGDMVMTTPVFRALKKHYPNARLVVVGTRKNGELLRGNTDVDEFLPLHGFWQTLRMLRRFKPEWGVAINPSPHEVGILYLSCAGSVTAFSSMSILGKAYGFISYLVATVLYESGNYVPREYLKLLEPFGIRENNFEKHLTASKEALARVRAQLQSAGVPLEKPLVVFAPAAGQRYKEWAPERFGEVARHVALNYGAGIALVGGPHDVRVGEAFLTSVVGIPVFNGTGQSIEELKALLSLASLVVSNDSGTVYIAESFGAATLIVIGITDPREHPTRDKRHRVVLPPRQDFVIHSIISDHDAVDVPRALKHLNAIPAARVIAEVDDLWRYLESREEG